MGTDKVANRLRFCDVGTFVVDLSRVVGVGNVGKMFPSNGNAYHVYCEGLANALVVTVPQCMERQVFLDRWIGYNAAVSDGRDIGDAPRT